ncbi:uncharacterized protein LOC134658158 [Cydia amplana]|uniref:uncharacterized protein LOC134658158 n=1 Tax=Cydia amplana TaxID=1869771 RepID=UPI002FE67E31
MFTFIFWTVLCFHSIQGLIELSQDITAASELLKGVSSQILAPNDSKLQEFAVIFNHYVNLTEAEKQSREVLSRLATESTNSTGDDGNEDLYGSLAWKTALDDALAEENITVDINKLLNDKVVEYLGTYASNPENLKALDLYQQRLDVDRKPNLTRLEDNDLNTNDTDAAGGGTGVNEESPFWSKSFIFLMVPNFSVHSKSFW